MGNQWHFEPDSYLAMVRSEIPAYDTLQERLASATAAIDAKRILDLGSGTGVTAQRVAERHPNASLIGIDASGAMLTHAQQLLPHGEFRVARLEDPLPEGRFDLVVSAFAIHHLDHAAKADLYRRVADALTPNGLFVWCDVIIPTGPIENPVPLDPEIDQPASVAEHLDWLHAAGLRTEILEHTADLAVVAARSQR